MDNYLTKDESNIIKLNIKCTYNGKKYVLAVAKSQIMLIDEATYTSLGPIFNNVFIITPSLVLFSVTGNPSNKTELVANSTPINSVVSDFITPNGDGNKPSINLVYDIVNNTFTMTYIKETTTTTKGTDGKDVTTTTSKTMYVGITENKPTNVDESIKLYDYLTGYESQTDSHVLQFSLLTESKKNYTIYIIIIVILLILLCCCCSSFLITRK
jgi:hypothetical protein